MRRHLFVAVVLVLAGGCGSGEPEGGDALASYTDPDDGCEQVVSAIGYADDLLLVLGQEEHQKFDAAVRSRLAAVEGTISLEVEQPRKVADRADRAQASENPDDEQIMALREYRREAAQLVIDCAAVER